MSLFRNRITKGPNESTPKIINPVSIFKSMVHQEGYDYLRDIQKEFLDEWEKRREEKDVVGVLNTGAGKTLIGQLMLLSKLNEGFGPVAYLCPDNQLVEQALLQAKLHNIPVVTIAQVPGQSQEIPLDFINKKAILITTFERVFNGKSIFGVDGYGTRPIQEIGSMVIDDAHACIKKARKQCTIRIPSNHASYKELISLFHESLKHQGQGKLSSILRGDSSVSGIVPYWSWREQHQNVYRILEKMYNEKDDCVQFPWALISDEISKCECFISGNYIEISPLQLPLERIPAYHNAKHRFVLSATFNNNTDLILELGIDQTAVLNPIKISDRGDAGERLIIAPKRYYPDLSDDYMRKFISKYSETVNVAIIVPNPFKAAAWEKLGAKIVHKNNVEESIEELRTKKGNLMVFLNKYDGLDLSGDMCRILVLDGLPTAQSVRDHYLSIAREGSKYFNAQIAQTIEQGLGRGVRSGSDHCAVFILDNSLSNFIGIDSNRDLFKPTTKKQIEFGLELFKESTPSNILAALKEIEVAVDACISKDEEWRHYHKEMILEVSEIEEAIGTDMVNISSKERSAIQEFRGGSVIDAEKLIRSLISTHEASLSSFDSAWYYQTAASMVDSIDPIRAIDLQIRAKKQSTKMLIPLSHSYSKLTTTRGGQSEIIVQWLKKFSTGNDIIVAVEDICNDLIYSPEIHHSYFEKSVEQIGDFLGYHSQRPDEDDADGPDNLWRSDESTNFIIEVKNMSTNESISRADIAQLLHSIEWNKEKYGETQPYVPIIMHPASSAQSNAHPSKDSRIMDTALLIEFVASLRNFAKALSLKSPNSWSSNEIHQLLSTNHLNSSQFINKFTKPLK